MVEDKEYDNLLEEAYKNVKQVSSGERFEIPKIEGHFEGKKTVLSNFGQVLSQLRRDSEHFQKFLLKELAASGTKKGDRLVLDKKISREAVDRKIEQYAKEFVICRECGKPDTELIKEEGITKLHCLACGAKHPVQ